MENARIERPFGDTRGDDRISAMETDPAGSRIAIADAITCGPGDDVVFTDSADDPPADCEHNNIGLSAVGRTAPLSAKGLARLRIGCNDLMICHLTAVRLAYAGHQITSGFRRCRASIAPGATAICRIAIDPHRGRHTFHRKRALRVTIDLLPKSISAGVLEFGFPHTLTLLRTGATPL